MPHTEFSNWRKSSFSDGATDQDACVEVAFAGDTVGVRDSKDRTGTPLAFPAPAWRHFLRKVP